jgi:hypothetical protein
MRDGGRVRYVGPWDEEVRFGAVGHVLTCTSSYAHVQWDGMRKGVVGLHHTDDLEDVTGSHVSASLDDSLEVGASVQEMGLLTSLASAQEAYEETGGDGLVSHLASTGYLSTHASAAEEALQLITGSLQLDPVLRQLTSTMDPDEADAVYRLAARNLLIDSGDFQ